VIRACPWACEENSNSYWSDQAGRKPRGPDRPGQLASKKQGEFYHVKEELVYLGVDIAKSCLDAAIGSEKRRFANDAVGHRALIKWIKEIEGLVQVICEPSGGYERALIRALQTSQTRFDCDDAKAPDRAQQRTQTGSNLCLKPRQLLTAPRSVSPVCLATTFNLQPRALPGAVADLVFR